MYLYLSRVVFTSVLCQHQSLLSDNNNGRPLILSDMNHGNVDNTCHQPVIYDVVRHVSFECSVIHEYITTDL